MTITKHRYSVADVIHVLTILQGCPCGATLDALIANGVDPRTIAQLLQDGLVALRLENQARINLTTKRFLITSKGRKEIQR